MNAAHLVRLLLESLPAWAWKGAALLALAGAADAALRRRNPAVRHLLLRDRKSTRLNSSH